MQRINLSLHEIFPDPENMRFHDEKNLQIIMDGLLRHGQYRDFVIQKSNHIIRVGNGMYEAMKRLNWQDKVKCVVLDLTDEMGRVLSILDNRASDLSGTDEEMLASQLQALDEAVRAFCGYLPEEIDALLGDVPVPEFREEQEVSSEDAPCGTVFRCGEICLHITRKQYDHFLEDLRQSVGMTPQAITREIRRRLGI